MADELTVEFDPMSLYRALDTLGGKAEAHLKRVAYETAKAVRYAQWTRIQRRTGATANTLEIREDRSGKGYVVLTNDVRTEASRQAALRRRALSTKWRTRPVSKLENVKHVGLYLEYGTVNMGARPFFWDAAQLESASYDRRVREAMSQAIEESGLGS
jgi:hypothetical protein